MAEHAEKKSVVVGIRFPETMHREASAVAEHFEHMEFSVWVRGLVEKELARMKEKHAVLESIFGQTTSDSKNNGEQQ